MATNNFQLVFDPATEYEERIAFTVSEADIEDAISYGRVESNDSFDKQLSGTAYHKVMTMEVVEDDRIFESAWVELRNGKIIARNVAAMSVTEADLK